MFKIHQQTHFEHKSHKKTFFQIKEIENGIHFTY